MKFYKYQTVKQLDNFLHIINEIHEKPISFYNRKAIRIVFDAENELLRLYNVYSFRDYLKKVGFFFDDTDKSWVGHPLAFIALEDVVLKRILAATHKSNLRDLVLALQKSVGEL